MSSGGTMPRSIVRPAPNELEIFVLFIDALSSFLCFFFTWYQSDDRTRPELFAGLFHRRKACGLSLSVSRAACRQSVSRSTSSFWPNFKIFYARPYQHGKPSFPPFEVHFSDQLPESLERGWKAHYFFIHGLFYDWSPFRIHSTWGKREVIQRKVLSCNA